MTEKKPKPQKPQILKQQINQIYENFFEGQKMISYFTEIDHAPSQIISDYFSIHQNCLVVNFEAFDRYYEYLFKNLNINSSQEAIKYANIILTMNGQNDRAWNLKKLYMIQNQINLKWQLRLNQAVCLKCKKSSSYYEYRLKLIQKQFDQIGLHDNYKKLEQSLSQLHIRENTLINRVLQRFFRNYFVWMYRVKLIKLIIDNLFNYKSKNNNQNIQALIWNFLKQELHFIHKFLQKYCNDYSGYSYLINFSQRYIEKYSTNISQYQQNEIKWIKQLKEYCELAYTSNMDYPRFLMYEKRIIDKKVMIQF